jgi:hypothetical protein
MKNKRFTIPRSPKYARHLWGRAGTLIEEHPVIIHDYERNTHKDSKIYWLKFDKPVEALDEFGHISHLGGWEGVWIPQELITEAEATNG